MSKIKNIFLKLPKKEKIISLGLVAVLIFAISISIPSLARHKNRNVLNTIVTWDGSVASSYRGGSGTKESPYIISNASELAYFGIQLQTNDYNDIYFEINNDIIINNGIFTYDETDKIKYTLDGITYYVKPYTDEYYDNTNRVGTKVGNINLFSSLNNFKGHLNGNSFRIYGLYISNDSEKLGLFTNLTGEIKDLYIENSVVYGGNITGGLASDANNSDITNILYNGYIIGNDSEISKSVTATLTDQIIIPTYVEETTNLDLIIDKPIGEIFSSTLTGTVTVDNPNGGNVVLKINNVDVISDNFNIELGTSLLTSVPITSSTDVEGVRITLSNLSYNINYKYSIAGGIVGHSNSSLITNAINKALVYSKLEAGGIVGVATDTSLTRTYNTGIITGNIVGGLIGKIENSLLDMTISNSYNTGNLIANIGLKGLIGKISNNVGEVTLNNNFSASSNHIIDTIESTTVNMNNSRGIITPFVNKGSYNDNYNYLVTIDNLKDKNYVKTNLLFNEYVDNQNLTTNPSNAWIYEESSLPILYIDDLNRPIVNLFAHTYSWNNLSYELTKLKLTSNSAFSIEKIDLLSNLEIFYYISNSETPLLRSEIDAITDWASYTNIVEITTEGPNVIYVKVINGETVTYINSDILFLDKSGPVININIADKTWNSFNDNLNKLYINDNKMVNIEANDSITGLLSLEYYISTSELTLEQLNTVTWNSYTGGIYLNQLGSYVIYAKATDNYNNVSYGNTDYLIYNGYTMSNLNYGKNKVGSNNLYITNKSSISYSATYTDNNICTNCVHNLISNILLPINTKITLIDNNSLKVYTYQITTEDNFGYQEGGKATYPFTLFKEIGQHNPTYFSETNGEVNDNYKVIIDFGETNINTDYNNVQTYLELKESNTERSTIASTIKNFNIYSTVNYESTASNLYLNVGSYAINLNSDSSTDVTISTGLTYKYFYDQIIYDTTNEDKNIGLAIRLVDANQNVISKNNYKNLKFVIDSKEYYPDNSNTIRINLNGITDMTKVITIITTSDNMFISEGNYYLEISNYLSYDGMYPSEFKNTKYIPVTISNTSYNTLYNFNVSMDDEDRIIERSETNTNILFNLLESGALYSPSVRVSLYKKKDLTAYNQEYEIIDLNTYTIEGLTKYIDNVYNVPVNNFNYNWQIENYDTFEINLITKNLDKTGYKFVFELYDNNQKISTIEKKFIIR